MTTELYGSAGGGAGEPGDAAAHIVKTCRQCRFWKDPSPLDRPAERVGQWRECTRIDADLHSEPRAAIDHSEVYNEGAILMTRSDFGCLQFECAAGVLDVTYATGTGQDGTRGND